MCCDKMSIEDLYDGGPEVGHTCHVNEVHLCQQQVTLDPFLGGALWLVFHEFLFSSKVTV